MKEELLTLRLWLCLAFSDKDSTLGGPAHTDTSPIKNRKEQANSGATLAKIINQKIPATQVYTHIKDSAHKRNSIPAVLQNALTHPMGSLQCYSVHTHNGIAAGATECSHAHNLQVLLLISCITMKFCPMEGGCTVGSSLEDETKRLEQSMCYDCYPEHLICTCFAFLTSFQCGGLQMFQFSLTHSLPTCHVVWVCMSDPVLIS